MKFKWFYFTFFLSLSSLHAVCSGNSLGTCSPSEAASIPPSATCAIDEVTVTGASEGGQTNIRRTSFAQIPIPFEHTGGPGLTYTASLTGLNQTDSGTSITEAECSGSLTAFFSQSEQKSINVQVFQAELNRIVTSQNALQVIFDRQPPVVTIQRVFPGTGSESGPGLEYSAGTTYFTSQDIFIRARVVDPAPAQAPEKLSMQVIEGLSTKPPVVQGDSTNPGNFGFPLGLSAEPEGEYLLRIAGLDSDSELLEDGSPANVSEGLLLRVNLDKTDPIITELELVKNPQSSDQVVEQIPGAFIPSGRVRIRATFSEEMGTPPQLVIQQEGNGSGEPPGPIDNVTFDSELFKANRRVVEYEFSPLIGPADIGPATFTFTGGSDLAGRPLDLNQGAVNGGTVNRALIVDTVAPDLNRVDPQNAGEVRTIPDNNEKLPKDGFPRQITMIVRDYDLPQDLDLGDGGNETLLRQTTNSSGVDFSKIIEGVGGSDTDGIQVEVRDPSNNLISGTLVTQPPNGLIFLLPPVDLIFPQGRGLAPEGTYTVKVNLVDKVGNQGVETFFFVVDNTDIDANSIQVALFPVSDENADFTPDTPNPSLTNPIGGLEIPDNPDLVDLGTLTAINTINRFTVCSTDQTFDLTRTANFVKFKARLNGPDTVARTLNASGTAVLDSENLCQSAGSIAFNVSNDQKQAFPNLGLFPNPSSGPGANVEPGTRDPRFGQFDGPYLVELEALDDAGNRSTPINKEFLLDTTQPYTDDTFPKNNSKINSPLRHISAILVDPHPPRVHTFDETGYVNFGSGISVERSSLKLTLRSPYRQEVLGRSDLFLADGTLRGKLNYTHIPNSIDPTKPSYNPKDDAYRALLEIVDRNTKVIELPSNGDADGLYEIESVPVDNAGNSVDAAIAGQSGWQILPPEQRRERPKEVTKTFVFLLDSIAPSLEIDRPNTNSNLLTVSGRDFKLSGKTRDLSAQQEATRGGAGIDRVEYEIVLQTLDGELVPPVEASLNGPAKQNPILKGQLADLEPLIDTSKNPHTSSTRPMDPRSYANLELEERIWKIDGKLPPQNEVISQSDNQTGKQANYFLKIHSYDLAGNVAKESLQLVLQFGKLPSPVIVAPDFNESLTKGIVKFEWKPVSNAVEYELSISHPTGEITTDSIGSNGQSNLAFNKVLSKEGEYSWFVRSKDSVGNFGDPTISRKFVIDRTPPSINILSWLDPSPEAKGKLTIGQFRLQIQFSEEISAYPEVSFRPFNSSIPPQIIVTDKVAGQYWEGIATIPETATAKWDGLATIKVKSAIDKAGNQMIENRNFKFEIDTGPSYDVKFFENPVFQTEVVFVIRSSENLAGPPVLFNAQSVQVVGQNLVKVGDATFTAILKITGSTSVEEGSIEITGTDLLGNSSTRKVVFPLQAARQDGSATLQNSRLKIHLPDGALEPGQMVGIFPRSELLMDDEDMAQMSRARIQNARGMRKIRSLESLYPWSLKLSSPGSLEILVDEVLGKGEGIFLETEDGLLFLGAGSEKNLPISRFGSLAVYQDSSSPVLEPENEEDLLSLDSIRPVIRFRVFDEGSGLRENSFRGEINGTLFEFRALEGDLIEARIPGSLPRGSHEINLEVQDRVGNLTRYSSHAVVAGPIRIQAVSFPNPARSSATIQYDLNRQAETIHLKIFDSNDGLVFQSNSEDDLELAISGRKNRYLWNLETNFGSPVSNGVYYCQLQAMDAQGRVDRAVIKIAVVR